MKKVSQTEPFIELLKNVNMAVPCILENIFDVNSIPSVLQLAKFM